MVSIVISGNQPADTTARKLLGQSEMNKTNGKFCKIIIKLDICV
jgi:hypothetical protein